MTGGVRDREELREHRAGIPIDVTEPALPVPPAGAPRDAGDDDDGSVAAGRRPDPHEGVILRVDTSARRAADRDVPSGTAT